MDVPIADVVHRRLRIPSCSSLLPHCILTSCSARGEEVHSLEPVEGLEILRSSLALEGFDHYQVLTVLEGGVLDILDRLEEWGYFPLCLPLLIELSSISRWTFTVQVSSVAKTWRQHRC